PVRRESAPIALSQTDGRRTIERPYAHRVVGTSHRALLLQQDFLSVGGKVIQQSVLVPGKVLFVPGSGRATGDPEACVRGLGENAAIGGDILQHEGSRNGKQQAQPARQGYG